MPIRFRPTAEQRKSGECRGCSSFCDRLVDPAGCLEAGCRFLYSYEESSTGRTFMGCLQGVFSAEIDVEAFAEAQAGEGFGGLKMYAEPLPQCSFSVERAYEGSGPAFECVNRRFFDWGDAGREGIRVFDLRNSLDGAA